PGTLTRLAFAEEAAAVHQLVAAVQRGKDIGKATSQAAQAAEKAANIVEEELAPVEKLQETVRDARRTRDAVGQGGNRRSPLSGAAPARRPTRERPTSTRRTSRRSRVPSRRARRRGSKRRPFRRRQPRRRP